MQGHIINSDNQVIQSPAFIFDGLQSLGAVDGPTAWLSTEPLALVAVILFEGWRYFPFDMLCLLARLQAIPAELYEAARVDGASKLRTFFSITLPLLAPTLAVALVFRTLDALRVFDLFQVVFGEQRYSMASYAYYQLIAARNVGLSSAASVVIFLVIFVFAIVYIRALGVDQDE